MKTDLQFMWAFLSVGIFMLISAMVLSIAGLLTKQPQFYFVIGTGFVVAIATALFVAAFIAGVDYIEHRRGKL